MASRRRSVPDGYTKLQEAVLKSRWNMIDTLGETLNEEHKKLNEAQTANAVDRQKSLLGYAHLSGLIYNGWQMGQITPVEFAQPSLYRAAFSAHPDCAVNAREAVVEAIKAGEVGAPEKFMALLGEMGNPDGMDQDDMTDETFLLLTLRAKYTLGAAIDKINEIAADLSNVLASLHILDAQNRFVFADLPWRAAYMRHLLKAWAPEMKRYDVGLQDNWVAVSERMTDGLDAFKPLMIALYTKAMVDYRDMGVPDRG